MDDGMCVALVDEVADGNAASRCGQFGVSHILAASRQAVLDGPIVHNACAESDAYLKRLVSDGLWLKLGKKEGRSVVSQPHLHPHLGVVSIANFLVKYALDGDLKPPARRCDESRRTNIATLVHVPSLQSFRKVVKFPGAEGPRDKVAIFSTRKSQGDEPPHVSW
jgi:hypothetical protein